MSLFDTTTRRSVLQLSGTALAAAVGAGAASANHFHADVETGAATNVGETTATLNGELLDMGNASSVDVWFDWGESDVGFSNSTPRRSRSSPGTFSEALDAFDGLESGEVYQFRAVSDTGSTTTTGDTVFFNTDGLFSSRPCDSKCLEDEL